MKRTMILLAALLVMAAAEAKTVKTTFEVKGNCGMCQKRIEGAAGAVGGVTSARWNKQTGVLTLVYDNKKTSPKAVQQAIAAKGHDAGKIAAGQKAYDALPGCCKYRAAAKKH